MAFEYLLDFGCPIKEKFGMAGFVQRVKDQARIDTFFEQCREMGKDEKEILNEKVTLIMSVGGQQKSEEVRIKDLKKRADELHAIRGHCFDCPANAHHSPFGCLGMINYPISLRGEEWIMDQYSAMANPNGSFIQLMIEDNKISGNVMATQRPTGLETEEIPSSIFESVEGITRDYTTATGQAITLSSDQIFEMIFGLGRWEFPTMLSFLREFGAIDPDRASQMDVYESVRSLMRLMGQEPNDKLEDLKGDIGEFLLEVNDEDDRTIVQFKTFLHAIYVAYKMNAMIVTDA